MKLTRMQGLVLLNALLVAALAAVSLGPRAEAQEMRPRGQYLLAAGTIRNTDTAAIYIVDTTNQELIAVAWNAQLNQLEGLGYRNLAADAGTLARGGGSRN